MKVERTTVKTEAVFSEDKQFRFLLYREWDKTKKHALILSISPSEHSGISSDLTTMLVQNNVHKLEEYGGFSLVNLISAVGVEAKKLKSIDGLIGDETDKYIVEGAKAADIIVLTYGRIAGINKAFTAREAEVLKLLEPYRDKLHYITDISGREGGLHPLTPAVRNAWLLQAYTPPVNPEAKSA